MIQILAIRLTGMLKIHETLHLNQTLILNSKTTLNCTAMACLSTATTTVSMITNLRRIKVRLTQKTQGALKLPNNPILQTC